MASLLFLQDTLFHMMHSLILCLFRADIHPGQSIPIIVTGTIRNTQQGTPHTVLFAARPFWTSNLAVNRAVFVFIGVPPVSTAHKKKSHSFCFMDLFHLYHSVILKQTFPIATFINKQYVMATFIFILLSLFYESS
jgi:hypothetical protein